MLQTVSFWLKILLASIFHQNWFILLLFGVWKSSIVWLYLSTLNNIGLSGEYTTSPTIQVKISNTTMETATNTFPVPQKLHYFNVTLLLTFTPFLYPHALGTAKLTLFSLFQTSVITQTCSMLTCEYSIVSLHYFETYTKTRLILKRFQVLFHGFQYLAYSQIQLVILAVVWNGYTGFINHIRYTKYHMKLSLLGQFTPTIANYLVQVVEIKPDSLE